MTATMDDRARATVAADPATAPRRWRASTIWHLVWLVNIPLALLFDPTSGVADHMLAVAVIGAFVPFYLAVERRPGPLRRWAPTITAAAAALTVPFNAGTAILIVYAAAFAGSNLPRRLAMRWLAGLTLLIGMLAAVSSVPFPWVLWTFTPPAVLTWIVGLLTVEHRQDEREARMRNARVEHLATLAERERIARDLHDLLGHSLTGIVVRAQLAQRLARADLDAAVAEMAEIERAARAALTEVRATVTGWRQVMFDDEVAAARDALAAAGVELEVVREPGLALTPSAETALGLALREAVTNVVRHAHARRCTVGLRWADSQVVLEIADDGVGGNKNEGTGLTGMRERIAALGGDVRREVGHGCTVRVEIPAAVAT